MKRLSPVFTYRRNYVGGEFQRESRNAPGSDCDRHALDDLKRQMLLRELPEIDAAKLRRLGDSKDPRGRLERLASRLEAIDRRYGDFLLLAVAADSINDAPDRAAMGWLVPYLRRRGIKASRFHADIRRALRCD